MAEPSAAAKKALSLLGLARGAGALFIGQDKIAEALRGGGELAVFVTEDAGGGAMRKFLAAEERGRLKIYKLKNTGRALLGKSLGVSAAQAAALPAESGLAEKILAVLNEDRRSDADE